jgi:hypothetical protein
MRAPCPDCGGTVTTFEHRSAANEFGAVTRVWNHEFEGRNYTQTRYILMRCAGCGRGGLATTHMNPLGDIAYEETFYPACLDRAPLPAGIPDGVVAEYREAELCASVGAWRAGSALIRSALEKTLSANGYVQGTLAARIVEAAGDGLITAARRQRAHENIRVLGNDVLHDEWRVVTEQEYSDAHHYAQRILEDFYDQRAQVEAILRKAQRIPAV